MKLKLFSGRGAAWIAGVLSLGIGLGAGLGLTACGGKDGDGDGEGEKLTLEPADDGYRLTIPKSKIGEKYLFAFGYIEEKPSVLPYNIAEIIVRFEQQGDSLVLLSDESMNRIQPPGVDNTDLIAAFDLRDGGVGSDYYAIDFDKGIQPFVNSALNGMVGDAEVRSSTVSESYVKDGVVFVDQVLDISTANREITGLPGHLQYTLRPYTPSDFAPRDAKELMTTMRAGYFTVPAVFPDTSSHSYEYAMRWDARTPIVWHLSANTPESLKQAVKDGILYWNKIFGSEVLQVAETPAEGSVFEPGQNVFQWVNDDKSTFAYAQFATDPLTGRIYQSYVVMPSAWYAIGKESFGQKVVSVARNSGKGHAHHHPASRICDRSPSSGQMLEMLGHLLASGASPAMVEQASQDLVRTVVAHEVGHTLGLRHNFVAKTNMTLSGKDYAAALNTYFKSGDPGAAVYSSSVMDYSPLEADALIGAQIRTGTYVGAYDKAAIGWGYQGTETKAVDGGMFCTDENTMMDISVECRRHQSPGTPGVIAYHRLTGLAGIAARRLAAFFVAAKTPQGGYSAPSDTVALDPVGDAANTVGLDLAALNNVLFEAEQSPRIFDKVMREYKVVDDLNALEVKKAMGKYQVEQIKKMGGIKVLTAPFTPKKRSDGRWASDAMEGAYKAFVAIIDDPAYQTGKTPSGADISFTAEDIAHMKAVAQEYFRLYEASFLDELIGALIDANYGGESASGTANLTYPYGVSSKELGPVLTSLGSAVILAESKEKLLAKVGDATVSVPKAYFNYDLRMKAAQLFSHDLYDAGGPTFNEGASATTQTALQTRMDALTGNDLANLTKLPRDLMQEWGMVSAIKGKLNELDEISN